MIEIKVEGNKLHKLAESLAERQLRIADTRAINVAIRKANTQYRRLVVSEYNLKYADTAKFTVTDRATYSNPEGKISGYLAPISLSRFNPRFIKNGRAFSIKNVKENGKRKLKQSSKNAGNKSGNGVSIEVKKGERKTIPFAFLIDSSKPGLSTQIWARGEYSGNSFRTNKSRKPITPLKTVSPFGAITNEVIQKKTEKEAKDDMKKEFERQIELLVKKAQG
ncbi:MAG: hypothetical protein JSS64_03495 [Bacteroidetes bacterium]|nr:hypothetical protein [Bacteroidota bacterium]